MEKLENINFDVYNTLNLIDPVLGESYISEGYNPFGSEYRMKKDVIEQIIVNNNMADPALNIDFLNYDNKTVIKHFKNSLTQSAELQTMLETDKEQESDPKAKQKINEGIIYLKNRQKMLEVFCRDLKNPNISAIETFKKLARLNKKYAKLLEESFFEKAKIDIIHQNFMALCMSIDQNKKESKAFAGIDKARNMSATPILKQKEQENVAQKQAEEEKAKERAELQRQKELQEKLKQMQEEKEKEEQKKQEQEREDRERAEREKEEQERDNQRENSSIPYVDKDMNQ